MALSLPAAPRHYGAWQWLVVASSAKQKQQLHHQQLTNGSTILEMFRFPEFSDLFNLSTVYWINFSKNFLATHILKMLPTIELRDDGTQCSDSSFFKSY
jgi:hypothetical protein